MTPKNLKLGIGILAKAEIIKGATDEKALAVVLAYFPEAKTTLQCIEHYRSRLRSEGYDVPTSAEARRKPRLHLVA